MPFIFDWNARVTDIIMIVAILAGPIAAVWVTIWAQDRSERRRAKMDLFMVFMGERKSPIKPSPLLSKSLNTIDVVFSDNRTVIDLWHKYYALLAQPPAEERGHTWLELLQAMSIDLHYPKLTQIDLDKFYTPQGHIDDAEFQRKLGQAMLRVFENTEHLLVEPKKNEAPPDKR
jgi:hypothetical protein